MFFDIELIDISENVDNFKFTKIDEESLKKIKTTLSSDNLNTWIEFKSLEGTVFLDRKYFRGLIYAPHFEREKSVLEDTLENSVEIKKVNLPKKVKPKGS